MISRHTVHKMSSTAPPNQDRYLVFATDQLAATCRLRSLPEGTYNDMVHTLLANDTELGVEGAVSQAIAEMKGNVDDV